MQDMKDALRWLELEERRVRLLEREAKALSIIAPSLRRKTDEGDSDDTQDSVRHFLSSYARRGDAEAKVEIAISTFFSKYMQYSTVRNLQRIPRKEFYQAVEVYCWFAGSIRLCRSNEQTDMSGRFIRGCWAYGRSQSKTQSGA